MSRIWQEAPRLGINDDTVRASFPLIELGSWLGSGAEAIVFEDDADPTKALKFRAIDATKIDAWTRYYQSIIDDRPEWYQHVDSFEIRAIPGHDDYVMICVRSEKLTDLRHAIKEVKYEAFEFEQRLEDVVSYWDLGDHNIMVDRLGNFKMIDGDPSMTWTSTSLHQGD